MTECVHVPMITIHPDRINMYSSVEWFPDRKRIKPKFDIRTVDNKHAGKISEAAHRKVSKAIEYLLFMSHSKSLPDSHHGRAYNFKIAFITLTLPSTQQHSDNDIKHECLNQLLIELRRKWRVRNYIWRAEKQKNGNIHFHILCDKFVPWSELRDCWNRICNKLGYVDRYREQMKAFHAGGIKIREDLLKKWDYKKQIKAYQAGKANDWNSPNSTDVHSIKKVSNIKSYVCKYLAKNEQTEGLTGRLWGCNVELSNIPGARLIIDNKVTDQLNHLLTTLKPDLYVGDHFTTMYVNATMLSRSACADLFNHFASFLVSHFGFSPQLEFSG